jgi:hypothetical protein
MGLIGQILGLVFGNGRNVIRETAEVFRENAEAGAERGQAVQIQAMQQHGAEFEGPRQGGFDRFMDGLNRLPRPAMALGTLGLIISAMIDPVWFSMRMQGLSLVPEPLWWLLGVVVSFYFGARHQLKTHQFQRDIAGTMAMVPQVVKNIKALRDLNADTPGVADTGGDARLTIVSIVPEGNPALEAWRQRAP